MPRIVQVENYRITSAPHTQNCHGYDISSALGEAALGISVSLSMWYAVLKLTIMYEQRARAKNEDPDESMSETPE